MTSSNKLDGEARSMRKGDFLAVLAKTEWGAIKAMRAVKAQWGAAESPPKQATVFDHWRSLKLAKECVTQNVGDAPAPIASATRKLNARYGFAVQTHASIGPSCALALFSDGTLTRP